MAIKLIESPTKLIFLARTVHVTINLLRTFTQCGFLLSIAFTELIFIRWCISLLYQYQENSLSNILLDQTDSRRDKVEYENLPHSQIVCGKLFSFFFCLVRLSCNLIKPFTCFQQQLNEGEKFHINTHLDLVAGKTPSSQKSLLWEKLYLFARRNKFVCGGK